MFDFIRRLFARGATTDSLPPWVATITVEARGGPLAARWARVRAQDGSGNTVLKAWATVETDPALVLSSVAGTGFPEGDYAVDAVLPARTDAAGVAGFGPHPVIRLRAAPRESMPPPPGQPAFLMIHGGPAGRPTDGSVRLSDDDLARLLNLLPEDPEGVLVRLVLWDAADADTDDFPPASSIGSWSDDGSAGMYYEQYYSWTGTAPGEPPYADIAAGTAIGEAADSAVASSLTDLGYTAAATGVAAATSDQAADAAWTPAPGAYGP